MRPKCFKAGESGTSENNLKAYLKKFIDRFIRIRGTPREIALGFATGVFVGMSPTMGFQMPIAIFWAALFKWNKISAAAGVWITNPFTAPFIYSFTYYIGSKIYGINKAYNPPDEITFSLAKKLLAKSPGIFWSLSIGGLVLGIPLAVAAYHISYRLVSDHQEEIKNKIVRQKKKIVSKKEAIQERIRSRRLKRMKRKKRG